jgi:hypothetical protein
MTAGIAAGGADLVGVARGVVLGYLAYYLYVMLTIGRELWGLRPALAIVAHAVGSLVVTKTMLTVFISGSGSEVEQLAATALASLVGLSPLLLYGAWRTDLVRHLRSELRWAT